MGRWRRFGLATLAGAAAALGHAPFGWWPVSLLGFAVLIYLVATVQRDDTSDSHSPTFTAWGGGIGYFALALHWIVEPFLVDVARHGWMAPFALILMAAGLALFWAVAGWLSGNMRWPAIGFAVAVSFAELARGHVLTGFPWALPAYIWADTWLMQSASLFGPYGLSALTLILVALPAAFHRAWLGAVIGGLCFASLGLWGFADGYDPEIGVETVGTVRLVQPNAPQHEKWDPEKAHIFVDRAIGFTAEPKSSVDLIVWPESAIPYPLDLAAPVLSRIATAADGVPVITGINRRTEDGEWFNAMVTIDAQGVVADTYDKVHLVPFGEYIPMRINLLRAMAGFSGFGFSSGGAVRLVDTPLGQALPLICYEVIFPGHGRGVDARPDYLLQITNDAWFGAFSGPYQHLDQARFRAVEQGVPLIRAANTGVSAVIDPYGRVTASLALGQAGHLDAALPAAGPPTLYSRIGDNPVAALILATLLVLVVLRRRNTIAKQNTSS